MKHGYSACLYHVVSHPESVSVLLSLYITILTGKITSVE